MLTTIRKHHWIRPLTLCLLLSVPLAACQTSRGNEGALTPAQQKLRQEADLFSETSVTGGVVGALGGALLGYLVSGGKVYGAVGGAVAGAAVGLAAGYYVDTQNKQYANLQQALRARIEAAQKEADRLSRSANAGRQVVAQQRMTIASLNQKYRSRQITANQYRQQVASLNGDVQSLQTLINQSDETIRAMQEDIQRLNQSGASYTDLSQLTAQLNRVRQENQSLRQQFELLGEAYQTIPPEARPPQIS